MGSALENKNTNIRPQYNIMYAMYAKYACILAQLRISIRYSYNIQIQYITVQYLNIVCMYVDRLKQRDTQIDR